MEKKNCVIQNEGIYLCSHRSDDKTKWSFNQDNVKTKYNARKLDKRRYAKTDIRCSHLIMNFIYRLFTGHNYKVYLEVVDVCQIFFV